MDIKEKAQEYAQNKMQQVLNDAVAEAYMEGYKQGYKDGKAEKPVECNDDDTEYVDLGLPSGTLWAKDYVKNNGGDTLYLPYNKAKFYKIPDEEQVRELLHECQCIYRCGYGESPYTEFIGPNGNIFLLDHQGFMQGSSYADDGNAWFWFLNTDSSSSGHLEAVCLENEETGIKEQFSGFSLPFLLVK